MIFISIFSGKCDVYDTLIQTFRYSLEELQNGVNIYVGDSKESLHISKMKDLIPYYPYLITSAYYDNINRKANIQISSESYVDREEREILQRYLEEIIKIYKKCKRNKVDFTLDLAFQESYFSFARWNYDVCKEIYNRVQKDGAKANIEGIHLKIFDKYRQNLAEELGNVGE